MLFLSLFGIDTSFENIIFFSFIGGIIAAFLDLENITPIEALCVVAVGIGFAVYFSIYGFYTFRGSYKEGGSLLAIGTFGIIVH